MREAQRRNMLGNMGLRILQPRFILAGAKPSIALPLVQEPFPETRTVTSSSDVLVVDSAPAEKAFENRVGSSQSLAALFDQPISENPVRNSQPKPGAPARKNLKCRYRLLRVGEFMMLLDQPSLEWADAARAKSFFAELYYAIAGKKFEYWAEAQFDWPPVKNFPMANDRVMLAQSLSAFMQENARQSVCKWIVIWGQSAGRHLFENLPGAGEAGFLFDMPVLMVENYQEYWQSPQKKVLLWQHLQVIKKSLVLHG